MKKHKSEKSLIKQNSKIAIAVTMLAIPMLYSPSTIFAQETKVKVESASPSGGEIYKFAYKLKRIGPDGQYKIVGSYNKHVIYQTNKGELCWVDPDTGDLKFLPKGSKYEEHDHKHWEAVSLIGVDQNGNVIQINAKGEKFFLNSKTFDMIFVK